MEGEVKIIYLYLGDTLFSKLRNFECQEPKFIKFAKAKVLDGVKCASEDKINDLHLGWSFLIYRIGSKYYHTGFFNSREDTVEIFKDCTAKELNIRCNINDVFAFSTKGDLLHYSTINIDDVASISFNQHQRIKDLKPTDRYSVILFDDGTVGLLNLQENDHITPIQIQSSVTEIACGKEHTLLLTASGQVHSFGSGSRGQLGHATIENQDKPMLLEALDGIRIKSISCGGWHSAAISEAGDLYTWGWNESGQLGFPCAELHSDVLPLNEIETVCCLPKLVEFDKEVQIKSVSCGTRHTAILTEDNEVWSWGWNDYGQLGHGENSLCDKPCKISLADNFLPKNITCAFWSTLISGSFLV